MRIENQLWGKGEERPEGNEHK